MAAQRADPTAGEDAVQGGRRQDDVDGDAAIAGRHRYAFEIVQIARGAFGD